MRCRRRDKSACTRLRPASAHAAPEAAGGHAPGAATAAPRCMWASMPARGLPLHGAPHPPKDLKEGCPPLGSARRADASTHARTGQHRASRMHACAAPRPTGPGQTGRPALRWDATCGHGTQACLPAARCPHHAAGGDKVEKLDTCVRQRQRRRRDGHSQLAAARLKHLNRGAGSAAGQLEHLSYATGRPRQLAAACGRQGALARRCALSSPGRTCFPLPGGTSRPHQAVHVHRGLGKGVQVGCRLQGCLHDRRVLTLLWRLQATEHRELF